MKFGSLQQGAAKILRVRSFKEGTVTHALPSEIPDGALAKSENMWRDGGLLSTRLGLCADTGNIIKSENPPIYDSFSYQVADSGVYIDGEYKKIAVEEYLEDDSRCYCRMFLVGADGLSAPAGYFLFSRITDSDFYLPTNILFYGGKKVNGAGVFALVSAENIYKTSENSHRIYELSESLDSWQEIYSFYTPVVYINGRGTRYEEARATGLAFTGQPKFLESQNMLTDRFKAYFTSDGYSSCFRLPFSGLNSGTVICRVYRTPSSYTEWRITESKTSATALFYTAQITLNIDREKGMIYFTSSSGEYSVPMMSLYHENNICVIAGKDLEYGFESAVSSTCQAVYGSKIIFSGGRDKNIMISVNADNPLYFPVGSLGTVGGDNSVNALLSYKNGILAFKEDSIYNITVNNGSAINSNSLLADDSSVFSTNDSFAVKKISEGRGLNNKRTCLLCDNKAVWLGSDRRLYALNTSSFEITVLSEAVGDRLDTLSDAEIQSASAVEIDKRYLLLTGKKAVIMDYRERGVKTPSWYFWSFEDVKTLSGMSYNGELLLFCVGSDGNVLYTAKLSGGEDTDIRLVNGLPQVFKTDVKSSLETKQFDFGSMTGKKLIDCIFLAASARQELEIFINGKRFDSVRLYEPELDCSCGALKSVKLIPHLSTVKSLQLGLKAEHGFSLGELSVNYRESL